MWLLHRKAKEYHKLPSEVFGERDALAAYMLDNAVLAFGTLVENTLLERDEIGEGAMKQSVQRYTLSELLDPNFRLPRPDEYADLRSMAGVGGVVYDEV